MRRQYRVEESDGRWHLLVYSSAWDKWEDWGGYDGKADAVRCARDAMSGDLPLQPCEVPGRLRLAASYLRECGVLMDYIGGLGQWGDKGREAIGAAEIAKQWADEMEAL